MKTNGGGAIKKLRFSEATTTHNNENILTGTWCKCIEVFTR